VSVAFGLAITYRQKVLILSFKKQREYGPVIHGRQVVVSKLEAFRKIGLSYAALNLDQYRGSHQPQA
jgi:hypothetical protein